MAPNGDRGRERRTQGKHRKDARWEGEFGRAMMLAAAPRSAKRPPGSDRPTGASSSEPPVSTGGPVAVK